MVKNTEKLIWPNFDPDCEFGIHSGRQAPVLTARIGTVL